MGQDRDGMHCTVWHGMPLVSCYSFSVNHQPQNCIVQYTMIQHSSSRKDK